MPPVCSLIHASAAFQLPLMNFEMNVEDSEEPRAGCSEEDVEAFFVRLLAGDNGSTATPKDGETTGDNGNITVTWECDAPEVATSHSDDTKNDDFSARLEASGESVKDNILCKPEEPSFVECLQKHEACTAEVNAATRRCCEQFETIRKEIREEVGKMCNEIRVENVNQGRVQGSTLLRVAEVAFDQKLKELEKHHEDCLVLLNQSLGRCVAETDLLKTRFERIERTNGHHSSFCDSSFQVDNQDKETRSSVSHSFTSTPLISAVTGLDRSPHSTVYRSMNKRSQSPSSPSQSPLGDEHRVLQMEDSVKLLQSSYTPPENDKLDKDATEEFREKLPMVWVSNRPSLVSQISSFPSITAKSFNRSETSMK